MYQTQFSQKNPIRRVFPNPVTYIRNNNGHSTDPCGTPDMTLEVGDLSPLRTTYCDLLPR